MRLLVLVLVLLLAQMLDGMDMLSLSFVGPLVRKDLVLSGSMFGACVGAGFLGLAVGAVLFGAVADRIGTRKTILLVVSLFGIGSLATSRIANPAELLVLRLLTGIALGGLMPVSSTILLRSVAASARTTIVTIVVSGSAGGAVFSGLVSSYAVPAFGWRVMFVVGGVAPLVLIPMLAAIVPGDDASGASEKAASRIAAPIGDERRSIIRDGAWRVTFRLWGAMFLVAIPVYVAVGWLPSLVEAAGLPSRRAALAASLFTVGGAFGGIAGGALTDRFGRKIILLMALAGAVASIALGSSLGRPFIPLVAALAGFFAIGLLTLMCAVVGQHYSEAARGRGTGAAVAISRIGASIAPWAAGRLLDLGTANILLFSLCAVSALLSGLAFLGPARSITSAAQA